MTIINTSTSAFYERSNAELGSLRARAETMRQQISSETRLSRSSQDPVAASRLRNLARADALSNIDMANANRAATDLTLTDSAMSDVADYIMKAKELATQAATGTLNDDQRASIGQQRVDGCSARRSPPTTIAANAAGRLTSSTALSAPTKPSAAAASAAEPSSPATAPAASPTASEMRPP